MCKVIMGLIAFTIVAFAPLSVKADDLFYDDTEYSPYYSDDEAYYNYPTGNGFYDYDYYPSYGFGSYGGPGGSFPGGGTHWHNFKR